MSGDTNLSAITVFVGFVVLSLGITWWSARRTHSAGEFYTAGGKITGFQNGLALAGDFMSAATFLGLTGLTFLGGADAVLSTALEFQHPELGAVMVSPLPGGDAIGKIIRQHHESFDGFGFPDALAGDAIEIESAILALAEFTVERTTASAIAEAESLAETAARLTSESGRRFPPHVAEA